MLLRNANFALAVLHAALAVIIGCILVPADINLDFNTRAHTISSSGWASTRVADMDNFVKGGLIFFYAWTSLAHLLYGIDPGGIYSDSVKSGIYPLRWFEYAVSATVMLGIMIVVSGVKDQHSFSLMLYMSVAIMSTGYWYETTRSVLAILIGFMLLIGISAVIIQCFTERISESRGLGYNVPGFVYGVVYIMLTFYGIFGFVPLLPKRYQEYTYMGLSLSAKTCLGVLLAIGASTPRPQKTQ